jgi:hypothetical protein
MSPIKRRILNILIGIDQIFFTLITLGGAFPDETLSSWTYRKSATGNTLGRWLHWFIDTCFYYLEKDHCYIAYLAEYEGLQRPEYAVRLEYRKSLTLKELIDI